MKRWNFLTESVPEMQNLRYFEIAAEDVLPDITTIIRILGYRNEQPPEYILEEISNILTRASGSLNVKGGYLLLNPDEYLKKQESIICRGKELNTGRLISARLGKAESVVIFSVTSGNEISELINKLNAENDPLGAYIADIIGSESCENGAEKIESRLIRDELNPSGAVTNRYSPGYCGWNLEDQKNLFSLLPDKFCGITLNASYLMIPVKSVSGIIGYGEGAKRLGYSCSICDREDCIYRNNLVEE